MISLIHRKKTSDTEARKGGYLVIAVEEVLFWGGLAALIVGTGWLAIAGGISVCISIVLAVYLYVFT